MRAISAARRKASSGSVGGCCGRVGDERDDRQFQRAVARPRGESGEDGARVDVADLAGGRDRELTKLQEVEELWRGGAGDVNDTGHEIFRDLDGVVRGGNHRDDVPDGLRVLRGVEREAGAERVGQPQDDLQPTVRRVRARRSSGTPQAGAAL